VSLADVQTPIHWEAVLVTAIPAGCALLAAVVSAVFSYLGAKRATANKEHLINIDEAVNGIGPDEQSLRENVQTLVARKDLDPDKETA
jgi:hypothetical protein